MCCSFLNIRAISVRPFDDLLYNVVSIAQIKLCRHMVFESGEAIIKI
ncbi:hypothetical protein HMPREF7545_0850 [Selenomonas noxia ATCC 43541]|nr:hypothetical protein HMPREF7545_0850 [Selenomonas noxia ATCC 43541]